MYSLTIQGFQTTDRHQLRHNGACGFLSSYSVGLEPLSGVGDRDALWFFLIAIVAACERAVPSKTTFAGIFLPCFISVAMMVQSWAFQKAASTLTWVCVIARNSFALAKLTNFPKETTEALV